MAAFLATLYAFSFMSVLQYWDFNHFVFSLNSLFAGFYHVWIVPNSIDSGIDFEFDSFINKENINNWQTREPQQKVPHINGQ